MLFTLRKYFFSFFSEGFEDIKQSKGIICKIQETINATDEEIGYYCKHSKEIKDNCSKWVFERKELWVIVTRFFYSRFLSLETALL